MYGRAAFQFTCPHCGLTQQASIAAEYIGKPAVACCDSDDQGGCGEYVVVTVTLVTTTNVRVGKIAYA